MGINIEKEINKVNNRNKLLFQQEQDLVHAIMSFDDKQKLLNHREYNIKKNELMLEESMLHNIYYCQCISYLNYNEANNINITRQKQKEQEFIEKEIKLKLKEEELLKKEYELNNNIDHLKLSLYEL